MADKPTVIKAWHIGKKYIIKHNREVSDSSAGKASRLLKVFSRQTSEDFWALKDINFEIKQGERVGIIGKNGAGKSTLLKLLSRITEPTEGRIELLGKISAMLEVGTGFNPELTGRENVYLNGAILGMSKTEIDGKFDNIVEFSEIGKFIDTPVKRYSSGMYVRLAFAVASHLDPDILIIDEVLAVGDQKFRQKCMDRMNEIAESNKTIICVSHQMNVIRELCGRIMVLQNGELIYDGEPEDGIKLYTGISKQGNPDFFELGSLTRPAVYSKYPMHLESLEFLNNPARLAGEDSLLKFALVFLSHKNIVGVRLRMIIRFNDDSPAGVAVSEALCDTEEDKTYTKIISFDTSCLFPGSYKVNLSLFESDATGTTVYLDYVSEAVFFEVVELKDSKRTVYNHSGWGHVRLPCLEVVE